LNLLAKISKKDFPEMLGTNRTGRDRRERLRKNFRGVEFRCGSGGTLGHSEKKTPGRESRNRKKLKWIIKDGKKKKKESGKKQPIGGVGPKKLCFKV